MFYKTYQIINCVEYKRQYLYLHEIKRADWFDFHVEIMFYNQGRVNNVPHHRLIRRIRVSVRSYKMYITYHERSLDC